MSGYLSKKSSQISLKVSKIATYRSSLISVISLTKAHDLRNIRASDSKTSFKRIRSSIRVHPKTTQKIASIVVLGAVFEIVLLYQLEPLERNQPHVNFSHESQIFEDGQPIVLRVDAELFDSSFPKRPVIVSQSQFDLELFPGPRKHLRHRNKLIPHARGSQ